MADSVTTSEDKFHRPTKKRALSPTSKQAASVDALFANPDGALRQPSQGKERSLGAPPEIVANVQGSSAGAGSGEFHVYKASRRREYERLRVMDEESRKEEEDKRYEEEREAKRRRDEEKTGKNRARREKAKMRKDKKSGGGEGDVAAKNGDVQAKAKLKANVPTTNGKANGDVKMAESTEAVKDEEVGIVINDDD